MLTRYYKKKQRITFKKGSWKVPNLSEEEKDKKPTEEEKEKGQYGSEWYKTFLENKKQRLVEYINNYSVM